MHRSKVIFVMITNDEIQRERKQYMW